MRKSFSDVVAGGVEGIISAAEVASVATGFPAIVPYHPDIESPVSNAVYGATMGLALAGFLKVAYVVGAC